MKQFESFLAPQLEKYLLYRQRHGFDVKTPLSNLRTFDRYLREIKTVNEMLPSSFFLEMQANIKAEGRSVNGVISSVRVFFNYLVRQGYYKENPLQDVPRVKQNTIIPFIFTPDETDQLLTAICGGIRHTKQFYLKDLGIYLVILLLARCGLRISEPLRLQMHHYRSIEKTIYIQKTKFKKDRLIPVPLDVVREIKNYLSVRGALLPTGNQNPHLFVSNDQKGINEQRIRTVFHWAVRDNGLDRQRRIVGNMNLSSPTPHSLRHSFAINTLKRIKEQGKSAQNALPVLSVYMGHTKYTYTVTYLKFLDADQRQDLADFVTSYYEQA